MSGLPKDQWKRIERVRQLLKLNDDQLAFYFTEEVTNVLLDFCIRYSTATETGKPTGFWADIHSTLYEGTDYTVEFFDEVERENAEQLANERKQTN